MIRGAIWRRLTTRRRGPDTLPVNLAIGTDGGVPALRRTNRRTGIANEMAQYKTTAAQRPVLGNVGRDSAIESGRLLTTRNRLATGAKPVCPHCNGQMSLDHLATALAVGLHPMRDPWHYGHCPYFAASIAAGDMSESGRYSLPYDNAARC